MADRSDKSRFQVCDFDIYNVKKDRVPDDEELRDTADAVVDALRTDGLVLLKNTGFNLSLISKAWHYFKSFLEMPSATRDKYRKPVESTCGIKIGFYSTAGNGGYFDLLQEETESIFFIPYQPCVVYPETELPGFTKDMLALFKDMSTLLRRVAECVSLGYQNDRHAFDYAIEGLKKAEPGCGNFSSIRLNYYGPLMKTQESWKSRVRFAQHYDFTILTLLFSDEEGLQMRDKEGQWLDVPCIPGTCLVMAGKALTHMCGQQFYIPPHRVVANDSEKKSVAFFLHNDVDTLLQPAPDAPKQVQLTFPDLFSQYKV